MEAEQFISGQFLHQLVYVPVEEEAPGPVVLLGMDDSGHIRGAEAGSFMVRVTLRNWLPRSRSISSSLRMRPFLMMATRVAQAFHLAEDVGREEDGDTLLVFFPGGFRRSAFASGDPGRWWARRE